VKKVLIVDDEAELRDNLAEILAEEGFRVATAVDGDQALEKASRERFDVVLLDLIMPGKDGMEVLAGLRRISPVSRVIIITAYATVDSAVKAIRKGAVDYVTKPFTIDELLVTIKRVLAEACFETKSFQATDLETTLSALANGTRRNILFLLDLHQFMGVMEITRSLHLSDHTRVLFHLRTLRDAGLTSQDLRRKYHLTSHGRQVLDCLRMLGHWLAS